jgi:hypothetical protein
MRAVQGREGQHLRLVESLSGRRKAKVTEIGALAEMPVMQKLHLMKRWTLTWSGKTPVERASRPVDPLWQQH